MNYLILSYKPFFLSCDLDHCVCHFLKYQPFNPILTSSWCNVGFLFFLRVKACIVHCSELGGMWDPNINGWKMKEENFFLKWLEKKSKKVIYIYI